jgi:hypothetical protein
MTATGLEGCRVGRFRHKNDPHIGGVVRGQAVEGLLPVP